MTSLCSKDPVHRAKQICGEALETGFGKLLENHSRAWESLWEQADIRIKGDSRAQLAVRFSLYHLLSIAPHHHKSLSIPARGLSGQVYKGGIFWDTEIFMLPFFKHNFPDIAKTILEYRVHSLNSAKKKAAEYGYKGAFYAWEGQENGDDACTNFNVNNIFTGRPIRTFFRDKQIHISADIAVAVREYVEHTRDYAFLVTGGFEVILECVRFYFSWAYFKTDKNRYELLDVTGPDEYHERVHNNFYTNYLVKKNIEALFWSADILKNYFPLEYDGLYKNGSIKNELLLYVDFLKRLYVQQPDSNSIIPQFDDYLNLEDISLKSLLNRKKHPHEYLGGGDGLARWTTILKQADVILALSLYSPDFSNSIKLSNYEYYEPRTEHGSSLSACAYSILAAEVGKIDIAYNNFIKSAEIDIGEKTRQYVGDLFIGGTHPGTNGGIWLTFVQGFCGIRIIKDVIHINPRLPGHWESVQFKLIIHSEKIKFYLDNNTITISFSSASSVKLKLCIQGKSQILKESIERSFTYES